MEEIVRYAVYPCVGIPRVGNSENEFFLGHAAQADDVAWSATPHLLLCEYKEGSLRVTPHGELKDGELKPLKNVKNPQGKTVKLPFIVTLT